MVPHWVGMMVGLSVVSKVVPTAANWVGRKAAYWAAQMVYNSVGRTVAMMDAQRVAHSVDRTDEWMAA